MKRMSHRPRRISRPKNPKDWTAQDLEKALNKYIDSLISLDNDTKTGETNYKLGEYPTILSGCNAIGLTVGTFRRWMGYAGTEDEEMAAKAEICQMYSQFTQQIAESDLLSGGNFQGLKLYLEAQHSWNKEAEAMTAEEKHTIIINGREINF